MGEPCLGYSEGWKPGICPGSSQDYVIFSSVILRNLGIDCRIDPGWEFLEQEWKKEKDLLLSELFRLALDLSNIISQNE